MSVSVGWMEETPRGVTCGRSTECQRGLVGKSTCCVVTGKKGKNSGVAPRKGWCASNMSICNQVS